MTAMADARWPVARSNCLLWPTPQVAPYFIDGVFTGECRKDLIDQCGEMVCGWSNSLKQLLDEKKSCDASTSGEYLGSLMKDEKALEKISMFAGAETGDEEA